MDRLRRKSARRLILLLTGFALAGISLAVWFRSAPPATLPPSAGDGDNFVATQLTSAKTASSPRLPVAAHKRCLEPPFPGDRVPELVSSLHHGDDSSIGLPLPALSSFAKGPMLTAPPEKSADAEPAPGNSHQCAQHTPNEWPGPVEAESAEAFGGEVAHPPSLPASPGIAKPAAAADAGVALNETTAEMNAPEVAASVDELGETGASLLLPPDALARRSVHLERIARQADQFVRRGFELGGRRAYFAARSEFVRALRLVAQGLDTEHQTTLHSRALSAGLTAIKECDDFIPDGSRLEADLDLPTIIRGHRTPVLQDALAEGLAALSALKCYLTFAQEQLAVAAGREVAGSMALLALGKLHAAMASPHGGTIRAPQAKAIAFYQAALLACPRNHMAANDLGTLLARGENYQQALSVLKHSLSIRQQSTGWHNLAVVYGRLGQVRLARRAEQLAAAARRAETGRKTALSISATGMVRWLDPHTFAQTAATPPAVQQPGPTAGEADSTAATKTPATTWRLPWQSPGKR